MTTECIIWSGYVDRNGYARRRGALVHRLIYELAYGAIPNAWSSIAGQATEGAVAASVSQLRSVGTTPARRGRRHDAHL